MLISSILNGPVAAVVAMPLLHVIAEQPHPITITLPNPAITRVIDGDTVDINNVRYRLAGIDTPENNQTCLNQNLSTYDCSSQATEYLKILLATKSYTIRVTGVDRNKRKIAWFDLSETTSINCEIVRQGYGWAYRYYSKDCVPAELQARNELLGVFATTNTEPWTYRRKKRAK